MERYTEPDLAHAAVLSIDVQKDFALPGAPFEVPGTAERLPGMAEALEAAREAGLPIIHVVRLYKEDASNVDLFRKEAVLRGEGAVLAGSEGACLPEELLPAVCRPADNRARPDSELLLSGAFQVLGPEEWILYKPRFGAFYRTDLEIFLRERKIDTLIFMGCNFPNCPRTSIYEASERDFKLVVLRDALSGLYERGEEELARIGVRMKDVADWKRELAKR
ncbi:MAG: cysteine hydrolase [Lachnospiraceae bacterium]|nr:cysteine hydrolase [Lachnospiraceae bacterium]